MKRWRFRPRAADRVEDAGKVEASGPIVRPSPGLALALERAAGSAAPRVLDLGRSMAGNVQFLTAFARHVRVVDLLGGPPDAAPVDRLERGWGLYDLVLAWDVFNYLERTAASQVAALLARLSRTGAVLHAVVVTGGDMPAAPTAYRIVDPEHLEYRPAGEARRPAPGLTSAAVERLLAGFRCERAIVLRHGVLEVVAVRDDT